MAERQIKHTLLNKLKEPTLICQELGRLEEPRKRPRIKIVHLKCINFKD